jgi:hypothetical protein
MDDGAQPRCPACGSTTGGATECPACALPLDGGEADAMRGLRASLGAVDAQIRDLEARRRTLLQDLDRRVWARRQTAATPSVSDRSVAPSQRELGTDQVRNVLLFLGTALLALAALAFTAVAWARFGDGGRAGLLAATTALAIVLAAAARRRLPATAEALCALAIALALIDWYALRRAGVGDGLSDASWWALGGFVVAVFAAVLGFSVAPRTARVAVTVLLPVATTLSVVIVSGAPWSLGLGFALVAAALAAVGRQVAEGRRGLGRLVAAEATLVWIAGAIAAAVAAVEPNAFVAALLPAVGVLALALAPAIVAAGKPTRGAAAALAVAAPLGAVLTLCATALGPAGLATVAALFGVLTLAGAGWAPRPWRDGSVAAASVALAPGAVAAATAAMTATFAPLGWLASPWTGSVGTAARSVFAGPDTMQTAGGQTFPAGGTAVVDLLVAAAACVVAGTRAGGRRRLVDPGAAAVAALVAVAAALVLLPIVAGASAGAAAALTVATACGLSAAAAVVGRAHHRVAHGVATIAIIPAVAALGWSAVAAGATCTALAAVIVVALVAAAVGRAEPLRTVHLAIAGASVIALVGLAASARGWAEGPAGFAAGVAAAVVTVAGAVWWRDSPRGSGLEVAGACGLVVGLVVAAGDTVWLAATLTAAVPWLTIPTIEPDRRTRYGIAAAVAALGATWAWLAVAGVDVVEAYTLPAAGAALVIGELALSQRPRRSLLTIGPAIALALGPSVAFAVRDDDLLRGVLCAAAAFVLVLVGARRRLQAPLVLGAATLVTLGIDTLGPAASRLPRWAVLAISGIVLLWIGATFERRREAMRGAAQRFTEFA